MVPSLRPSPSKSPKTGWNPEANVPTKLMKPSLDCTVSHAPAEVAYDRSVLWSWSKSPGTGAGSVSVLPMKQAGTPPGTGERPGTHEDRRVADLPAAERIPPLERGGGGRRRSRRPRRHRQRAVVAAGIRLGRRLFERRAVDDHRRRARAAWKLTHWRHDTARGPRAQVGDAGNRWKGAHVDDAKAETRDGGAGNVRPRAPDVERTKGRLVRRIADGVADLVVGRELGSTGVEPRRRKDRKEGAGYRRRQILGPWRAQAVASADARLARLDEDEIIAVAVGVHRREAG